MSGNWLSLSEAADVLGVHPSTVRNWADQGRLPVHRTQGGHRRFKRSELEVWTHSERSGVEEEATVVVQSALGYTRMRISDGQLEAEDWYQKLDNAARDTYRRSGRDLLQGLITFISSDQEAGKAQAHALGYDYATIGRRQNLTPVEATQAFLFFRNAMLESMMNVYEASAVHSPHAWGDMLRKIHGFTDHVLLSLLKTYQAFERGSNGNGTAE